MRENTCGIYQGYTLSPSLLNSPTIVLFRVGLGPCPTLYPLDPLGFRKSAQLKRHIERWPGEPLAKPLSQLESLYLGPSSRELQVSISRGARESGLIVSRRRRPNWKRTLGLKRDFGASLRGCSDRKSELSLKPSLQIHFDLKSRVSSFFVDN